MVWLYPTVKNYEDTFISFDRVYHLDLSRSYVTDGHRTTAYASITRQKSVLVPDLFGGYAVCGRCVCVWGRTSDNVFTITTCDVGGTSSRSCRPTDHNWTSSAPADIQCSSYQYVLDLYCNQSSHSSSQFITILPLISHHCSTVPFQAHSPVPYRSYHNRLLVTTEPLNCLHVLIQIFYTCPF